MAHCVSAYVDVAPFGDNPYLLVSHYQIEQDVCDAFFTRSPKEFDPEFLKRRARNGEILIVPNSLPYTYRRQAMDMGYVLWDASTPKSRRSRNSIQHNISKNDLQLQQYTRTDSFDVMSGYLSSTPSQHGKRELHYEPRIFDDRTTGLLQCDAGVDDAEGDGAKTSAGKGNSTA